MFGSNVWWLWFCRNDKEMQSTSLDVVKEICCGRNTEGQTVTMHYICSFVIVNTGHAIGKKQQVCVCTKYTKILRVGGGMKTSMICFRRNREDGFFCETLGETPLQLVYFKIYIHIFTMTQENHQESISPGIISAAALTKAPQKADSEQFRTTGTDNHLKRTQFLVFFF